MRLLAALLVLICAGAFCQQAPAPLPAGVYRIGNGVTAPTVLTKADPQYSEEAKIAKLSGTVVTSLVVGEDGKAHNVRAERSPGLGLDEKAIEALDKWQFKPGLKDGTPVAVVATVQINFRLSLPPGQWTLARAVFYPPEATTRPVLTRAPYPPADPATGPNESVAISFDVDPTGVAANLHIEKSSSPAAESEVTRIVSRWQFLPGMKDGQAGSVPCTLEFVKGSL